MSKSFDKNNKSDSNQSVRGQGAEHSNVELLGQMSMET